MRQFGYKASYGIVVAATLSLLSACAGNSTTPVEPTTTNPAITVSSSTKRYCVAGQRGAAAFNLSGSGDGRLEELFMRIVTHLEDKAFCLDVYGYGDSASGAFRIEYEDDKGITGWELGSDSVRVGSFAQVSGKNKINLIFVDNMGAIQFLANETSSGSDTYTGSIRYYNFPSYQSALNASIQEMKQKCQSGQMTVAQCLGYGPPQFWWNTTEPASVEDELKTLLSSKGKELGTFTGYQPN